MSLWLQVVLEFPFVFVLEAGFESGTKGFLGCIMYLSFVDRFSFRMMQNITQN